MSPFLDHVLVYSTILLAIAYLVWRKLSIKRRRARDWTSGHSEVCTSCPVLMINQARRQKTKA